MFFFLLHCIFFSFKIQYNNRLSEERQGNWNIGECSHSNSNDQCGDEGEEQSKEVVVEDYPGVYLHIIELSDGTKELTRIQFRYRHMIYALDRFYIRTYM